MPNILTSNDFKQCNCFCFLLVSLDISNFNKVIFSLELKIKPSLWLFKAPRHNRI